MTKSKYAPHNEILDWTYDAEQLAAIRVVLPAEIDDEKFAVLIKKLYFGINVPSLTLRTLQRGHAEWDAELEAELNTLDAALRPLGVRIKPDRGVGAEPAFEALLLVREEVSRQRADLNQRHAEVAEFSPPDNRSSDFQNQILQTADKLWKSVFKKEPDKGKAYRRFLEAVAKPVLRCQRFRPLGANWTEHTAATHVRKLQSREKRLRSWGLWDAGF